MKQKLLLVKELLVKNEIKLESEEQMKLNEHCYTIQCLIKNLKINGKICLSLHF